MKKYFVLITIMILQSQIMSQTFELKFDHQALLVNDLNKSATFYKEILLLDEIETPGDLDILRWFSLGGSLQLHLIEINGEKINTHIAIHFALTVTNFDDFRAHLQDPDGHWIEINDVAEQSERD
jgi:catechol 2,3-dioxygenase-like lactoylglutathione lyase family enzyme